MGDVKSVTSGRDSNIPTRLTNRVVCMGVVMRTSEKKRNFLKDVGFEQTFDDEPREAFGRVVNMEKWERRDVWVTHALYIHFVENGRCFCNLYYGSDGFMADEFSERNLISEMEKRGFNTEEEL